MQTLRDIVPTTTYGQDIYFPYDISFVDCDTSPAVRYQIEEHLARLGHYYDRITDCRVVVRCLHKRHSNRYVHVHVQLDLPGRRLAVSREPEDRDRLSEARKAVHDAFMKITRQLEDYVKIRNHKKGKAHPLKALA